jgi:hypothetical protein
MGLKAFTVAVGTVALIGAGAGVAAASVASPAGTARTAAWRPGPAGVAGQATAVTGVRVNGNTTEFAFVYDYSEHSMYVRVNSGGWTKENGPGLAKGEEVVAAKAFSPSHLVVFTASPGKNASRVLVDKAGKWTVAVKFGSPIGSASVLSPSNIWVFGLPNGSGSKPLGVYHYDGKSWKHVAASFSGGGGVSATSAWAVNGTVAEHLAGGKWTGTNLASLIPLGGFGSRALIGVYPTSPTTAYAVGSGNAQDAGGPLVVLRFNGHSWKEVASHAGGFVTATGVAADGKGGLIIAGLSGAGGKALLLHYAKGSGKLVAESAQGMTNVLDSAFQTAANVPGTTVDIVGGSTIATNGLTLSKAKIYTSN